MSKKEVDSKNSLDPTTLQLDQENPNNQQNIRAVMYKCPLPPASELARYNDIEPGLANRIITMADY